MSIENEQLLRNELVVKTFTHHSIGKTRFRFSRLVKLKTVSSDRGKNQVYLFFFITIFFVF